MKRPLIIGLNSFLLILLFFLGFNQTVKASVLSNQGLVVSPAIVHLQAGYNQNSLSFTINITNRTLNTTNIDVSSSNFTSFSNNGSVTFLPRMQGLNHGLANNMIFENHLSLVRGQSLNMSVTINNIDSLSRGGHYGAVLLNNTGSLSNSYGNNFNSNDSVAVLVFLNTFNPGTAQVHLYNPPVNKYYFSLPSSLNVIFNNTGNIQTDPHGIIRILGSHNKLIGQGIINNESGYILPGTSCLYQVPIKLETSNRGFFANYKLVVNYQATSGAKNYQYITNLTYISSAFILGIIYLALLIVVVYFFLKNRYLKKHRKRFKTRS